MGMTPLQNLNWDSIDKNTPEGQALCTAVCMIAQMAFPKSKPGLVLEVIKDIRLYPLVNETLPETMERIVLEYQKKHN
jgi:hypothetical protein